MEQERSAAAMPLAGARQGVGERQMALAMLGIRCMQGFIFWGGGSRRFFYDPMKLDPDAHTWMAMKFQSAMPGALLGTGHLIAWMLERFWLLYPALIAFSAFELLAGVALIAGLLTRLAAVASLGFAAAMMLMFGWQGGTCIDEWTMASCNLAMGAALMLGGGGAWSLDNALLKRNPAWTGRVWFRWLGGTSPLPVGEVAFRRMGIALLVMVLGSNLAAYSYFRGSVVTPYHSGRVSPNTHHLTLSDGQLLPDGAVRFRIYLDGGTADIPAHVMKAEVTEASGRIVEQWDGNALSLLPVTSIRNRFVYNRFTTGPYGIVAGMGAEAVITLPPASPGRTTAADDESLTLTNVDGRRFSVKLALDKGRR